MDSGFLNVLHDTGDHDVFAVGERVDVDFNRIFEEMIDQHGAVVGILDRFLHIAHD